MARPKQRGRWSHPIRIALGSALVAAPAAAAEGGLEIFPDQRFFYLIVLFAVLIVPVNLLLVRPLVRVLDERRERIEGARARSEELAKEADDVLGRYEAAVRAAKEEAEAGRKEQLASSRREHAEALAGARAEAEGRVVSARGEVGAALAGAREQLRRQAEQLAREAASRVLGRPLS